MFRKKSLLISGAGLMLVAGANAGPRRLKMSVGLLLGGGGCLDKKPGTITKSREATIGRDTIK